MVLGSDDIRHDHVGNGADWAVASLIALAVEHSGEDDYFLPALADYHVAVAYTGEDCDAFRGRGLVYQA